MVQFLDWDTPVVVQRQGRMVQTVQSGGVAGAVPARLWTFLAVMQDVPEFPAKPGGASDSVHRKSWVMMAVNGFFWRILRLFSRSSGCPELSAGFRSWEPSMMKSSSSSRAGGWR